MNPGSSTVSRDVTQYTWMLLLPISVFIYGSHSILLNLCKDEHGDIAFNSAAVVVMTEVTKLLFSLALWLPELFATHKDPSKSARYLSLSASWVFAIPAMLYAINNNLVVYIQHYMDPASFQILSNLKIASTAILYRLFLKNRLSPQQWLALVVLMMGSICNSFGCLRSHPKSGASSEAYVTVPGLCLVLVYCSISGLSGIYTEYILKKQKQVSLNQQNIFLYLYGIALNSLGYFLTSHPGVHSSAPGFFDGFDAWTLVIILSQALNGMIVAYLFKHGNNIMRLFLISAAMLVTTVLSVAVFSLQLDAYFYTAFLSILTALWLYYK